MGDFSPASTARSMPIDRSIDQSVDMEQLFQTLLLNQSLEDGDSSEGSSSGLATARSGPAEALRGLRRSNPLRELSGEAFTRLLAGTLYEYDNTAPPTPLATPGEPMASRQQSGGDLDMTLGFLETAIEDDRENISADTQSTSGSGVFVAEPSGDRSALSAAEPLMVSFAADSEGSPSPSSAGGFGTARSGEDSQTPSLWSTSRSEARSDGFWRTARTVFGDTTAMSFLGGERPPHDEEVDGTVTAHVRGMLRQLAGDGELDESLAQSARRMVQLGAVASGQRLSDEEIAALPKIRFDKVEEQTCSVCLETYQQGEMLTALRCAHFFHTSCVTRWFQRSTQCPLCRTVQGGE